MKVELNKSLFQTKIVNAIKVLNKTLDLYDHNEIFLSFNGGKDCTVLLNLFADLFSKKHPNKKLLCLYIQPANPFDEIEEFIKACEIQYNVTVECIRGSVKSSLVDICKRFPSLKAVIMGCRRTDPYCASLNEFQETDPGWPPLMRVNPLLEWTCKDIWEYLNEFHVPYCVLYKYGYTSVGDKTNTIPNPHLKYIQPVTGTEVYLHADQLINTDHLERAGRL